MNSYNLGFRHFQPDCPTKGKNFYGLKLDTLHFHRPNHLPFQEITVINLDPGGNLNVHKQFYNEISNRDFNSDMIFLWPGFLG